MKTFLKTIVITAVAAVISIGVSRADEIAIKPLRYQWPGKPLFAEKVTPSVAMKCLACTDTLKPVVTQDSKLKTKTILAAEHSCKECKTTITRTGAQKATGKDARQHTCGALLAAVETCWGGKK
jgi:hypothetical protein